MNRYRQQSGERCRLKGDEFETAVDVKWISRRLPADNNYGILFYQTKKQKLLKHSNHSRTIGWSIKPAAAHPATLGGERNAEAQATAQRKLRVSTTLRYCQYWQYLPAPTASTITTTTATIVTTTITTRRTLTMPLTRTSAQLACDSAPRGMPVPAKLQFVSKFATSFAADAASSFASATLTVCSVVRVFSFYSFHFCLYLI